MVQQRKFCIRPATTADLCAVVRIVEDAKARLKSADINQWQNGYPNAQSILMDIANGNSYVATENGCVVATFALIFGKEPTYAAIEAGNWLTDGAYATVHRIATDAQHTHGGIGMACLQWCLRQAKLRGMQALRVDTHAKNVPMNNLLLRAGFTFCGIIYLADGAARNVYEFPFSSSFLDDKTSD